jgi:ribosomal protection tetracycline resistance protein
VAGDFRHLAPVVVMAALRVAGTRVCQPVDRFELELPEQAYGQVAALLGRLGAVTRAAAAAGPHIRLVGDLPTAGAPELAARLPDLTGGEGVLSTEFDHHTPVVGEDPPSRSRRGPDPADRMEWFRDVPRG